MLERTNVKMRFRKLDVAHLIVVVDTIALIFIINNNFLLLYKFDSFYLPAEILFGSKQLTLKLS